MSNLLKTMNIVLTTNKNCKNNKKTVEQVVEQLKSRDKRIAVSFITLELFFIVI